MKPAISVQGLSKEYVLGSEAIAEQSFREMVVGSLKSPFRKFRRLSGADAQQERFWALKDISFDVQRGEIVGVIGRNGAGKSTLLKVLSRITTPTTGSVTYRGRLASLLEVGTGFHPELTGRENIYLNGAILGMTRKEISRKLDKIVDFAGIDNFLDTPVKRFSSGMYVRLAFAVAAHLDPDILVVDEVLAVGDAEFQKKCIGKMQDVAGHGRTVIFVSHNMGTISTLCTKGMLLGEGKILFEGQPDQVIKKYLKGFNNQAIKISAQHFRGHLTEEIRITSLKINGIAIGEPIYLEPTENIVIEFSGRSDITLLNFNLFSIISKDGTRIMTLYDSEPGEPLNIGIFESKIKIPKNLLRPGEYTVGLGGERVGKSQWFMGNEIGQFTIMEKWSVEFPHRNIGLINMLTTGKRLCKKDEL